MPGRTHVSTISANDVWHLLDTEKQLNTESPAEMISSFPKMRIQEYIEGKRGREETRGLSLKHWPWQELCTINIVLRIEEGCGTLPSPKGSKTSSFSGQEVAAV